VEQYQIVGTGQTIDEARKNYRTALNLEDVEMSDPVDVVEQTGVITSIADVVISGNTCYYFTLDDSDTVYAAYVTVSENLPFLRTGDILTFTYSEGETPMQVTEIRNIEKVVPETVPETAAEIIPETEPTTAPSAP